MSKERRVAYGTGSVYPIHDHPDCPPSEWVTDETGKRARVRPPHTCKGHWRGALMAGTTANGTPRRISVYGSSEAEVKRKLRVKRREVETHGAPTAGVRASTTVNAWSETWLPIYQTRVTPNTYRTDASIVRKWILPTIGGRRLAELTPADVRTLTRRIIDAGKSTTTAGYAQSVLMRLCKAAALEGHQVPQRVFLVPRPEKAKHDRKDIPLDQARRILKVASLREDYSRWLAGFYGGLRQGEALGMEWDRVDFKAHTMLVSWQMQRLSYKHGCCKKAQPPTCGKRSAASCPARGFAMPDGYEARQAHLTWHWVRPKSRAGERVLPMAPKLEEALLEWRDAGPSPLGLVWARPADGLPWDKHGDGDAWRSIQEQAGARHPAGRLYTGHEMRHTTANLLRAEGTPEEVITAMMGHASLASTQAYLHADMDRARAALLKATAALD
ncbi:tyrosine-type recombinase/integrase [Xylanimonas oleitrophica]|uniref:tyrosine-type recombinase/integrase n=1 Tax=Xylanimonas oleitrophica TaxID=2607479 RepID=UPI0015D065E2|nr:site-specific integrase [Xylanimonas oleitrophica]